MPKINNNAWIKYGVAFRNDAHQLLAWGYEDARPLITPANEETEITGFITEAIEERLESPETPLRFDRYDATEDPPIPGKGRIGKRRRRVDIRIKCSVFRPRLRYYFEAKRLKKPSHQIGSYIGKDGLQMFIKESYASESLEAAMIGYVQNREIKDWKKELQKRIAKDTSTTEGLRKIRGLSNTWISKHIRESGRTIEICHVFLDCSL